MTKFNASFITARNIPAKVITPAAVAPTENTITPKAIIKKPNPAALPVSRGYRKGGLMIKSTIESVPATASTRRKAPAKAKADATKTKLVAKCGGKMKMKKMVGGKIMKKSGDCGCGE